MYRMSDVILALVIPEMFEIFLRALALLSVLAKQWLIFKAGQ